MSEHIAVENKRGLSPAALLVAGAFFMEFIDGTVIATALPDMAKSFAVQAVDLNIGISAFLPAAGLRIASAPARCLPWRWRYLLSPRFYAVCPKALRALSPCESYRV